jgi:hypothetical protein
VFSFTIMICFLLFIFFLFVFFFKKKNTNVYQESYQVVNKLPWIHLSLITDDIGSTATADSVVNLYKPIQKIFR